MTRGSMPGAPGRPAAPTAIVGRVREQAALRGCLAAAIGGRGGLVLVGGEAGIGKTTLVGGLGQAAAAQGALVLAGACYDLGMTPPYGPWSAAFAGAPLPDSGPPAPTALTSQADLSHVESQTVLFEEVRAFVAALAAIRPVVLILEDLHWSDPASLDLLRWLGRQVGALRVLLVATYRSDELTRREPLFHLLPRLVREAQAERIDLLALADDEVRELVRGRYPLAPADAARLATYLQARANGNPFFLSEVLRTLEAERLLVPAAGGWRVGDLARAPVPPLVRQVIEGRLTRLDEDDRQLLEVAAVIGQEASLDVWQRASDADGEALLQVVERALEAQLMRELPGTTSIAFTHALVRETLYQGQTLPQRRRRHRRAGEVLAERVDAPASVVAAHFEQADDPRAIDWLIRAGARALALYAANDAIAALTRAHEAAARLGLALPLDAYRARAAAYAQRGAFDQARRDHETVLTRARASGDRRAEWQALLDLGLHWAERDYERSGEYCRAALALARASGDQSMIAHSLNRVANWHANLDEPDVALPLQREALALFEARDDRDGIADTLDLLGMTCYLAGDLAMSTRYYERAIALLRELDDRRRLSGCLTAMAINGGDLDCAAAPADREAAYWLRHADEGLAVARAIDWPAGEALALFALSVTAAVRGDLGRALRDAEAALAIAERIGHRQWSVATRYAAGRVWRELFSPRRAAAELERALTQARLSGSRMWTDIVAASLASLLISLGELGEAAVLLGTVVQSDHPGRSLSQRFCWFVLAELALARDEPERCLATLDQLVSAGARPAADAQSPLVLKLRGDALARLGQFDRAEQTFLAARERATLFGYRPLLWRVEAARCHLHVAEGRIADAEAVCRSACAAIDAVAETIADKAARDHFRAQAAAHLPASGMERQRPAGAARLSPRELEVLRLLTEGKSDREIAGELSISPRTVMRHVTGILDKLGVSSRTAAAALAIRQRLV